MRRRNNGAPLRAAMADAGFSVRTLARATAELDPAGRGVAAATVGRLISEGDSGRDSVRDTNAALIAMALHKPVTALFTTEAIPMATEFTFTPKTETSSIHEVMIDAKTLARLIGKTPEWVWAQTAEHPAGSEHPWPVQYAGRSPRYLYSEVHAWMRGERVAA